MIRRAEEKDIPRIAEILVFGKRTSYRSIFQDDRFSFQELQVYKVMEEYEAQSGMLEGMWVYDDGILKGMIQGKAGKREEEVELCQFYVEPFFKGTGVGSRLLEHFLEEARKEKKKRVLLWVLKDNAYARRFYEKYGFAANGQEQLNEGTAILDVRYVKELSEQTVGSEGFSLKP